MFTGIKLYSRNFIKYNRNNQFGITLAIVAISLDVLWGTIIGAVLMMGATVTFGWWAVLPIMFTVLAVAHLIARPIIAPRFSN